MKISREGLFAVKRNSRWLAWYFCLFDIDLQSNAYVEITCVKTDFGYLLINIFLAMLKTHRMAISSVGPPLYLKLKYLNHSRWIAFGTDIYGPQRMILSLLLISKCWHVTHHCGHGKHYISFCVVFSRFCGVFCCVTYGARTATMNFSIENKICQLN